MQETLYNQKLFEKRKAQLSRTSIQLKKEFAGIDRVIDQVIDAITGWYCFNELQDKPLIVNLWGMTGTGKTSLVRRLTTLLDLENQFFKHDMRKQNDWELTEIMESLYRQFNGSPFVLLLDEFQQGKSYDETGNSKNNDHQIPLWELMDVGKISNHISTTSIFNLMEEHRKCENKLQNGAIVKNGVITYDPVEKSDSSYHISLNKKWSDECNFICSSVYETILLLCVGRFEAEEDVRKFLQTLNGPQSVNFLREILKEAKRPIEINATKSLIFVAGNLDRAYHMSGMISGEEDADEFHEESLKITAHDIKQALQTFYRREQISRLGNIHVIYPSLNKQAYQVIIGNEINKIVVEFKSMTGLVLEVKQRAIDKIYEDGVIPSQGTRPLFSTIQYLIKSNLPKLLDTILSRKLLADHISLDYDERVLKVTYQHDKKITFKEDLKVHSQIDITRKERDNDQRYVTSVHEAGHVIASILLLNKIPKRATSLSIQSEFNGFVQLSKPKTSFKKDIINWLAVLLAGATAERLVFGEDHYPMGTYGDYQMATNFIIDLVKSGVVSDLPAIYRHASPMTDHYFSDDDPLLQQEAKRWINESLEIARISLSSHMPHLILVAKRLLTKNYLVQADLKQLATIHLNWKEAESEKEEYTYAASFERVRKELNCNDAN